MDIGLATFLIGERSGDEPEGRGSGIRPDVLAREAEERGYESLFLTEHTHIPVAAGMVASDGSELEDKYRRTHDPFVALAFAAAATERLIVGTSVCLVIEHDPIVLAKEISSLDQLSGGRFVFGVGAGWNKLEMRNHGTNPDTRHGDMRERVEAIKAIWTQDEAEYHGKHVDFDPIWQWPKPLQDPHPPVYIGGNGPRVLDRVLRYGDGWMPNMTELETLGPRIAELRERAGKHVPVTYYGATPTTLDQLRDAGVDRALIVLPSGSEADVLASIPSLT
jgi:probable F420-dependent oxidoreductase